MKTNRFCIFLLLAIALGGSACKPGVALPTATPNRPAATATQNSSGVRSCDFVPGKSQPAQIPPGSPQPTASPSPSAGTFPQTPQEAASTSHQMQIFNQIVNDITYHYYAPDFNGLDWNAIQQKYKSLIQNGLSETDFARAMQQMVGELGDGVSYYASPNGQPTPTAAPTSNYAGIGVVYNTFTENGQDRYVLTWVYSGSPAEQAGLKIHDAILKVDGGGVPGSKRYTAHARFGGNAGDDQRANAWSGSQGCAGGARQDQRAGSGGCLQGGRDGDRLYALV